MELNIRVIPNSKEFGIRKTGETYSVKITQKAEKGKANRALEKMLTRHLGIKVYLISGSLSKNKKIRIDGNEKEILDKFDGLCKNE